MKDETGRDTREIQATWDQQLSNKEHRVPWGFFQYFLISGNRDPDFISKKLKVNQSQSQSGSEESFQAESHQAVIRTMHKVHVA